MTELTNRLDISLTYNLTCAFSLEEILFFDIETTGFSASNTYTYLIGCIYYKHGSFNKTQWFASSPEDEESILKNFIDFVQNFKLIVTYNGEGFDIPYISKRCTALGIPYNFNNYVSLDIYKEITCLRKILKLDNLKQKTIETYLGIDRDDMYSGGELINIYSEYKKTNNPKLLDKLLLHNSCDLMGLFHLIKILSYRDLFQGNIKSVKYEFNTYTKYDNTFGKEILFTLELKTSIPKRFSYNYDIFYITAYDRTAKLTIKVYQDELKFFYPNYKDYYYLPYEDRSIHKSVAFYVDKNYRTKAKAATCYSKKTGTFLPQYEEIVSPYFKIDYYDKTTYFEATDEFLSDQNLMKYYISHILDYISCK